MSGVPAAVDANLVRLMREASGEGMAVCRDAAIAAARDLDGDYVLAILIRSSNALAVRIRARPSGSDDPDRADREARDAWNMRRALSMRESAVTAGGDAWRRLDAVSGRHAPSPPEEPSTPGDGDRNRG